MAGERYAAGGIRTTVAATRAATDEQLAGQRRRGLVGEMRRQGTTTVEIKSGYGLTVARRGAGAGHRPAVHRRDDVPRRARGARGVRRRPGGYVDLVTGPMLEACAPYARWIDVFCERGAFDADQARAILAAGAAAGLRGRLHANQLGPGPASSWPASSACAPSTTAPTSTTPTSPRCATPDRRDAAAGRRVLDPVALPRRPAAARRRRRASRWRATATPARATPPRCRCASRWPSARCG